MNGCKLLWIKAKSPKCKCLVGQWLVNSLFRNGKTILHGFKPSYLQRVVTVKLLLRLLLHPCMFVHLPQSSVTSTQDLSGFRKILPRANYVLMSKESPSGPQAVGGSLPPTSSPPQPFQKHKQRRDMKEPLGEENSHSLLIRFISRPIDALFQLGGGGTKVPIRRTS